MTLPSLLTQRQRVGLALVAVGLAAIVVFGPRLAAHESAAANVLVPSPGETVDQALAKAEEEAREGDAEVATEDTPADVKAPVDDGDAGSDNSGLEEEQDDRTINDEAAVVDPDEANPPKKAHSNPPEKAVATTTDAAASSFTTGPAPATTTSVAHSSSSASSSATPVPPSSSAPPPPPKAVVPLAPRVKALSVGKKRLWTSGWNARQFPNGGLYLSPPPVLRWSKKAVDTFVRHWDKVQNVQSNGGQPGGRCDPDVVHLIPAFPWGLMSSVRDIGTLLIDMVMLNKAARVYPENVARNLRPFCSAQRPDEDTSTGCFWKPRMAECTVDPATNYPGLAFNAYIMQCVPPFWDDLVQSGDVWWETVHGERIPSLDPPAFKDGREGPVEWAVHSMLRSMLFATAWLPNADVQNSVRMLEKTLAMKKPMLAIQIRRTDKVIDSGIVNFRRRFPDGYVPLSAYGDMVRVAEEHLGISFKSVFLLTDDLDSWKQRDQWLAGFRDRSVAPLLNPYWLKYEALFSSPEWHRTGHVNLDRMQDPSITTFHRELIADMIFAAEHADYIVGCGSSGVSQFVAQAIGARLQIEGTWVGLFEEDYFEATVRR